MKINEAAHACYQLFTEFFNSWTANSNKTQKKTKNELPFWKTTDINYIFRLNELKRSFCWQFRLSISLSLFTINIKFCMAQSKNEAKSSNSVSRDQRTVNVWFDARFYPMGLFVFSTTSLGNKLRWKSTCMSRTRKRRKFNRGCIQSPHLLHTLKTHDETSSR